LAGTSASWSSHGRAPARPSTGPARDPRDEPGDDRPPDPLEIHPARGGEAVEHGARVVGRLAAALGRGLVGDGPVRFAIGLARLGLKAEIDLDAVSSWNLDQARRDVVDVRLTR